MTDTPNRKWQIDKNWQFKTTRSFDGVPIRFGVYCVTKTPRNMLIFLNGRTEWIEKYSFLPMLLRLPTDTLLLTTDHRGQGASGGSRADIDSYEVYIKDVLAVLEKLNLNLPYSMIGHSMGGLIGLLGCINKAFEPQHLLLSSPLLGFKQAPLKLTIVKKLFKHIAKSNIGKLPHKFSSGSEQFPEDMNPYTHDAPKYLLIKNAPYRTPNPTLRWINASISAIEAVFDPLQISHLSAMTMIIAGTEESIVDLSAIHSWHASASEKARVMVGFELVKGARHELFNESLEYAEQAANLTREWLKNIWIASPSIL